MRQYANSCSGRLCSPRQFPSGQGLRDLGFAVDVSTDGEEGLWYAQSNNYDVMVLDIMLPGIDGLTILDRPPKKQAMRRQFFF